jgi:vacuolar protein sorting-associated protein 35
MIYKSIEEIINVIRQEYAENAFKLMLNTASNMNNLKCETDIFADNCFNLMNDSLSILQDTKLDAEKKISLLNILISTTTTMKIIQKEKIMNFINSLVQFSQTLPKRSEQTLAILNCAHLFMTDFNNDFVKIQDCLTKAKRFADFAMSNPHNLNLFVSILNKYLFFIEKGVESLKVDNINDIIEIVKNHILTIKTESTNSTFLPEIERYFDVTMETIKKRKTAAIHKIFDEIIV